MFIFWWRGWGWLGGALPLLSAILAAYLALKVGNASYSTFTQHVWTYFFAGLAFGGALVVLLGIWRNSRTKPGMPDALTGLPTQVRPNDSLYWVPMRYWGYGSVLLGVAMTAYTVIVPT